MLLTAAPSSLVPGLNVDESWRLALNLTRVDNVRFGPDLAFTYGPWGFLDYPVAVDPVNVALGIGFAVSAVSVAWWAFWGLLRNSFGSTSSAALASAVLIVVGSPLGPSTVLLAGLVTLLAQYVGSPCAGGLWWRPATCAAAGAFLLQVKLSVGVFALAAVVIACAFAPREPLRRAGESVFAATTTFGFAWVVIGQSLRDLPTWLARSAEVVGGYSEAMGLDPGSPWVAHGRAALLAGAVTVAVARGTVDRPRRARLGLLAFVGLSAYAGYRQGFGRYDGIYHEPIYYLALLPFVLWGLALRPRTATRWAVLVLVLVLAREEAEFFHPGRTADRWALAIRVVTDGQHRNELLDQARATGRARAGFSAEVRRHLRSPVSVDGPSVVAAWMYGYPFVAPPAFQSYVVYTAELDAINARWLRQAPPEQLVLRPATTAIDGRNSLWDPPRYVLEELCSTRVVAADPGWVVLAKASSRCGSPVELSSVRVGAGEAVPIPAAGPASIVMMSFQPAGRGPIEALAGLVAANSSPLLVSVDGARFRLPLALSDGPLVASIPLALGWPASHGGGTAYRSVAFNRAGFVTFRSIPLTSAR